MTRTLFASAALVLATVGLLPAAHAQPYGGSLQPSAGPALVAVQYRPPPALRYERVPPPRAGQVWVNGHWEWRGHRHVWVAGYWQRARPGYHYRQPAWVERNGHWQMQAGRWDRDGDGVPNRYDRHPNNPYRR